MEREEDQHVFEANEVDEAVFHITEPAEEVTVEVIFWDEL